MSTTVLHLAPVEATSEAVPSTQPEVSQDGRGQLARGGQSWVGPGPGCLFHCLREVVPRDHRPGGVRLLVWLPAQGFLDG